MADTYTQLPIQVVFAVKTRQNLIPESFRISLEKYISKIVSEEGCKLIVIYCNPDHVHLFFELHPTKSISTLVQKIKSNSSRFINEKKIFNSQFRWQDGYGAFAYSKSHTKAVIQYILNQPEHHRKRNFRDEYLDYLEKFGINYNEKYVFDE